MNWILRAVERTRGYHLGDFVIDLMAIGGMVWMFYWVIAWLAA